MKRLMTVLVAVMLLCELTAFYQSQGKTAWDAMTDLFEKYGYYAEKGKKEKLLELDNDFHKLLFSIAGKTQLYEMMRGFSIHYDRLRRISLMADKEDKVLSDHRKIVEAIKAKDAALASQTMETHLNRYQINLSDMMAKYPQYFKA